ncbi:alpha/beta hydrolase fold domain-containing protein [Actinomadura rubrisoli]|uniref:Alpha/beta hydrolase n=1 Tax=Actinomadura rubrisoli TaxID=2530368 RepID=A0A4R5CBC2_9ACTN|nr:alpha/beta hydrolase fold domain-containing protein [Actinomadura rubrisoli]TDD96675.1 alpha/beta hydrolase [Actinomadura rubrisoli]
MGRDPEYLAFMRRRLAEGSAEPAPAGRRRTIEDARREHAADLARSPRPPVDVVQDLVVDGPAGPLAARLYRPGGDDPVPGLVYFHGGGWALGDVECYDPVVRALAVASGVAWVSVDYRRPPEDLFPAALDDAVAAVRWVAAHAAGLGLDPARLGVAGDSAGGQLAAAAASLLRAPDPARPALQVLLYPALDLREEPPDPPDPDALELPPSGIRRVLEVYLRGVDRTRPDVSPLLDPDPRGLPPTVIATAEYDRLRPQAEEHAARLRAAGLPVTLITGTGLDHGFLGWSSFARRPAEAVAEIGAAVRAALAGG